jgi:hypothetical protein
MIEDRSAVIVFCYSDAGDRTMTSSAQPVLLLLLAASALALLAVSFASGTDGRDVQAAAAPTDSTPLGADSLTVQSATQSLSEILTKIEPLSTESRIRRDVAQATFCLPQNVLGILYFAALQLSGEVLTTARMNETTVVITRVPAGVSLGRYIFVSRSLLSESTLRHEYGHTLQGYEHGPFYLMLEGVVSFVQAGISLVSPSYAAGYFQRWPENEANRLGGVVSAP